MYGEDLDLCFKVREAGLKVIYTPFAEVIHFGGGSSNQTSSSFSIVMMRSSVHQFIRRHRGPAAAFAYRLAMLCTAVARLVVIAPLQLLAVVKLRPAAPAWKKWSTILRWSIGDGPTRPGLKTASAA